MSHVTCSRFDVHGRLIRRGRNEQSFLGTWLERGEIRSYSDSMARLEKMEMEYPINGQI